MATADRRPKLSRTTTRSRSRTRTPRWMRLRCRDGELGAASEEARDWVNEHPAERGGLCAPGVHAGGRIVGVGL
eukprot:2792866-Rhodomonas_salina.2